MIVTGLPAKEAAQVRDASIARVYRKSYAEAQEKTERERQEALESALAKVRLETEANTAPITLTLADFENETQRLVTEVERLERVQGGFRRTIGAFAEQRTLWEDELRVLDKAIQELDQDIEVAVTLPASVDCPMCGQHYTNDIGGQFELIADRHDLEEARNAALRHLSQVITEISAQRDNLRETSEAFERVSAVLATHRENISLQDVIASAGRTEAVRILQDRLSEHDQKMGELDRMMEDAEDRMEKADDPNRATKIMSFYKDALFSNAEDLDISLDESTSLQGIDVGRGSAGPRGLAAYYYAFCQTAREFPNSAFCPLVLDEPNQKGQDKVHLPMVIRFLFDKAPEDSQVIVAAEKAPPNLAAEVIDVSWKANQLLRPNLYDEVAAEIASYATIE